MNEILNSLKYYQMNISGRKNMNFKSSEIDSAIFIVDAWGRERQQWELLHANQAFCDIFNLNPD